MDVLAARKGFPDRVVVALVNCALRPTMAFRSERYRSSADVSANVASRDLRLLCDRGLLIPRGERRGRRYFASEELKTIRDNVREERTLEKEDPFAETDFLPGLSPEEAVQRAS